MKNIVQLATYIFISTNFFERDALLTAIYLRDHGVRSALVGLQSGLIRGVSGLMIQPDYMLSDVEALLSNLTPNYLIFSGPEISQNKMFIDPRVHALANLVLGRGGGLLFLSSQLPSIYESTLNEDQSPQILLKGRRSLDDTLDHLYARITALSKTVPSPSH